MDLDKTCRTCLRSDGQLCPLVVSITPRVGSVSSGVVDLWKIYTRILVTYDSALPDLICDHCVDEIQQTYSFLMKCESSESHFRVLSENKEGLADVDDEYMDISQIKNENLHPKGFIPQNINGLAKQFAQNQKTPPTINHSDERIPQEAIDEEIQKPCELYETNYKFEVTDITDNVKYTLEIVGDRVSLAGGKVKQEVEINFDEDSVLLEEGSVCKEDDNKNCKTCPACSYQCNATEILERHIVDDHIVGLICTICKKEFNCTPLEHSTTHLSMKQVASDSESDINPDKVPNHMIAFPYKCAYCKKPFRSKTGYSYHLMVKHDYVDEKDKVTQCTVCSKFFKSNSALESHMRTHSGEKPYSCEFCSKMFVQKGHLTVHIRRHTGDRPYKCTFCPKDFSDKSNFNKHIQFHTGERPYKCKMCPRSFQRKKLLEIHMLCHTGEQPFECEICLKTFRQRPAWAEHMKSHIRRKHRKTGLSSHGVVAEQENVNEV